MTNGEGFIEFAKANFESYLLSPLAHNVIAASVNDIAKKSMEEIRKNSPDISDDEAYGALDWPELYRDVICDIMDSARFALSTFYLGIQTEGREIDSIEAAFQRLQSVSSESTDTDQATHNVYDPEEWQKKYTRRYISAYHAAMERGINPLQEPGKAWAFPYRARQ